MNGILAQVSISPGGMPKSAVPEALVTAGGVAGDAQRNLKYHGGLDRAVCIYSDEFYQWLRGQGVDLAYGQVGENFTTRGIDLLALQPDQYLAVGECVIQLRSVRVPCRQLNMWHPSLLQIIKGRTGWLARVVVQGTVRPGDRITLGWSGRTESSSNCFAPGPLA
jgi:MOSC domain-containing protein YiiM